MYGSEFRGSLGNYLRVENFGIAKLFVECVEVPRVESMIHDEVLEMTNDISLRTEFALLYDLESHGLADKALSLDFIPRDNSLRMTLCK